MDEQKPGFARGQDRFGTAELQSRFLYHPPSNDDVAQAHRAVAHLLLFAAYCLDDLVPSSREKSLAITKLEEARNWANAAIARKQAGVSDTPVRPGERSSRWTAVMCEGLVNMNPLPEE